MRRRQRNEPFYRRTSPEENGSPSPRVELIEKAGSVELSTDHPVPPLGNALIMESLATGDAEFFDGLLGQLVSVGMRGKKPDEGITNFMLAIIRSIGPRDEIETMLAAQMAAIHMATMTRRPPRPGKQHPPAGQCGTGAQQAGQHVCGAGGSAEAISDRGRAVLPRQHPRPDRRESDPRDRGRPTKG